MEKDVKIAQEVTSVSKIPLNRPKKQHNIDRGVIKDAAGNLVTVYVTDEILHKCPLRTCAHMAEDPF